MMNSLLILITLLVANAVIYITKDKSILFSMIVTYNLYINSTFISLGSCKIKKIVYNILNILKLISSFYHLIFFNCLQLLTCTNIIWNDLYFIFLCSIAEYLFRKPDTLLNCVFKFKKVLYLFYISISLIYNLYFQYFIAILFIYTGLISVYFLFFLTSLESYIISCIILCHISLFAIIYLWFIDNRLKIYYPLLYKILFAICIAVLVITTIILTHYLVFKILNVIKQILIYINSHYGNNNGNNRGNNNGHHGGSGNNNGGNNNGGGSGSYAASDTNRGQRKRRKTEKEREIRESDAALCTETGRQSNPDVPMSQAQTSEQDRVIAELEQLRLAHQRRLEHNLHLKRIEQNRLNQLRWEQQRSNEISQQSELQSTIQARLDEEIKARVIKEKMNLDKILW